MAKATLKTVPTGASVDEFLDGAATDPQRRADCERLIAIMKSATRAEARMWGPSIIGFGQCPLRYASGRELDWFHVGFSPRKGDISLYLSTGFPERTEMLARLGEHKAGVACVYVKRLADIDEMVLKAMVKAAVAHSKAHAKTPR